MRILFLLILICTTAQEAWSQNDIEAYEKLKSLSETYAEYKDYNCDFSFRVNYPGEESTRQKGSFVKNGEDFKLVVDQLVWIVTGKDAYFINHEAKEINITTVNDDSDLLTPLSILAKVNKEDFDYRFDPKDKSIIDMIPRTPEDFQEVSVKLSSARGIKSVVISNEDDSHYEYTIMREDIKSLDPQEIRFVTEDFRDYLIEDLRY